MREKQWHLLGPCLDGPYCDYCLGIACICTLSIVARNSVHNVCATVTQRSTVFKAYGWLYLLKFLRPFDVASGYIVATQPMFQSSNVCICLGLPYRNVSPSYRDVSKERFNCSSCVSKYQLLLTKYQLLYRLVLSSFFPFFFIQYVQTPAFF